jgi:diguanylate cyclase (GGDEF)-like protein
VPFADAPLPGSDLRRGSLRPGSGDWDLMLRSLMVIWAVGATFFLVVVLTTRPANPIGTLLLSTDVIAFAVLGLLLVGRDHLPWWTPDVCAYLLYLVVAGILLAYNEPDSPYAFLYLWLSVHAFYFLPWRRAAPQVAFVAAEYAAVLFAIGRGFALLRWGITVLTMVVTCTLVALLRARVDALVDRLANVARTDALTGLRNRRAYEEDIETEVARAERSGQRLALVVGDLDRFKRVNDRFGHPAGDAVLRRVADQLETRRRRGDVAARIGGEEFALLLPNTDANGALLVAERMRLAIGRAFERDPVPVTMSLGIACYPDDARDATSLFAAADAALLAAKKAGRNRAILYWAHQMGRRETVTPDPADRGT